MSDIDPPPSPLAPPAPLTLPHSLKPPTGVADDSHVTEIEASLHQLLDQLLRRVPGVSGGLVASVDGLVLAAELPPGTGFDPASIAAMSAATLALSNRLVQVTGSAPITWSHQRSNDGQVFVFGISHVAVLTVLAEPAASPSMIQYVGTDAGRGIERLFRGAAQV
jgi:predicted regulator of Ras-like GTPase activity (Roadblock/LC7/MglB family)